MELIQHPKIERLVLYALLSHPGQEERIFKLPIEAFNGKNKLIFGALKDLWSKNKELDTASVIDMSVEGVDIGDLAELYNSPEAILDPIDGRVVTHLNGHIETLLAAWTKNRVVMTFGKDATFSEIQQTIKNLEEVGEERIYDSERVSQLVFDAIHNNTSGLGFGMNLIDRNSEGIRKGDIVIVAGRPGAGKSTFMHNLCLKWLAKDKKILFASAEMSAEMIARRMLTTLSGRNLFADGIELRQEDTEAFEAFSTMPFYTAEVTTIAQLERILELKIKEVDVVLVDYLQLLEPSKKYKSLYERTTFAINELVLLAKKHNIPFIIASQYSRNAEAAQPSMADLRDSGQIEQAADMIISLWSKKDDKEISGRQQIYIDILKNRNGSTMVNGQYIYALWFQKNLFKFTEMEQRYEQ